MESHKVKYKVKKNARMQIRWLAIFRRKFSSSPTALSSPTLFLLLPLCLNLLFLTGCSKKDASQKPILESDILHYLPNKNIGFLVWNTQGSSYSNYLSSVWGKRSADFFSTLHAKAAARDQRSLGKTSADAKLLQWLSESQIISPRSPEKVRVSQGLFFAVQNPDLQKLDVSLFLTGKKKNESFEKEITNLKPILQEFSLPIEDISSGDMKAVRVSLDGDISKNFSKLFIYARGNKLAFSTNEKLSKQFLLEAPPQKTSLTLQESVKRSFTTLAPPSSVFQFFYIDIPQLLQSPLFAHTPAAQNLRLHLSNLSGVRYFSDTLHDTLWTRFAPTQNKPNLSSQLSRTPKKLSSLEMSPASEIFSLAISRDIIQSLKNLFLENLPPSDKPLLSTKLSFLDQIDSFGLGLTNLNAGSLFPALILKASSSEPEKLLSEVKAHVDHIIHQTGLPLSAWQSKSISEKKAYFRLSPLGIGVYTSTSDKGVIVTSSERSFIDTLTAHTDKEKRLLQRLSAETRTNITSPTSHIVLYGQINRVVELIQTTQANILAFTGGKANIAPDDLKDLKKMGAISLSLTREEHGLKLRGRYESLSSESHY